MTIEDYLKEEKLQFVPSRLMAREILIPFNFLPFGKKYPAVAPPDKGQMCISLFSSIPEMPCK
jgi:hypothetical protein